MLFQYKNVDFNINEKEISKEECIKLFTPVLDIAKKFVKIVEIDVESSEYAVILIEGGSQHEYAPGTTQFVQELSAYNISTATSDEDYGELDAINIYMEE